MFQIPAAVVVPAALPILSVVAAAAKVNVAPVQLYYDPQRSSGYVYIYPVFSNVDQLLFIEFQAPIEDFAATGDEFDLPQEWGEALKFNLALSMAPEYEVTDTKFKQIAALAGASLDLVHDYDQESTSMFIQPNQMLIDSLR